MMMCGLPPGTPCNVKRPSESVVASIAVPSTITVAPLTGFSEPSRRTWPVTVNDAGTAPRAAGGSGGTGCCAEAADEASSSMAAAEQALRDENGRNMGSSPRRLTTCGQLPNGLLTAAAREERAREGCGQSPWKRPRPAWHGGVRPARSRRRACRRRPAASAGSGSSDRRRNARHRHHSSPAAARASFRRGPRTPERTNRRTQSRPPRDAAGAPRCTTGAPQRAATSAACRSKPSRIELNWQVRPGQARAPGPLRRSKAAILRVVFPVSDVIPSKTRPFVTIGLIAACTLAFVYELQLDRRQMYALAHGWGAVPADLRWRTLFSSLFLHDGWIHSGGNTPSLWICGDTVEYSPG